MTSRDRRTYRRFYQPCRSRSNERHEERSWIERRVGEYSGMWRRGPQPEFLDGFRPMSSLPWARLMPQWFYTYFVHVLSGGATSSGAASAQTSARSPSSVWRWFGGAITTAMSIDAGASPGTPIPITNIRSAATTTLTTKRSMREAARLRLGAPRVRRMPETGMCEY